MKSDVGILPMRIAARALFAFFLAGVARSEAVTVRASRLTSNQLSEFQKGVDPDLVIEFQKGDRLPVRFQASGDLIESLDKNVTEVEVRRTFFLKLVQDQLLYSADQQTFIPFSDAVGGQLTVNAGSDQGGTGGLASHIQIQFDARLK